MFEDANKPGGQPGDISGQEGTPAWLERTGNGGADNFGASTAAGFGQAQDKRSVVEDILANADTAPAEKPPAFRPKEPGRADFARAEEPADASSHKIKKIFALLVIFAVLGLVVALGYFGYKTFLAEESEGITTPAEEAGSLVPEEAAGQETPAPTPSEKQPSAAMPAAPLDSDQDGLTDAEEKQLGTDINNADSDSDGLFDREEVMVYKTNPLIPDTDGDGYLDGSEVKSGFNPNGAGRLYDINQ